MLDRALLTLTRRVTTRRFFASPAGLVAGLAFPAWIAWIGLAESYGTAAKLFFFLLPHAFLVAAQDLAGSDIASGALENGLFVGGRFRGYLAAKGYVVAAGAGAYALALFALFAAWGLAVGEFRAVFLVRLGLALLAGWYYVALAGLLSHRVKGGSNVLALLLAQAGVALALVVTAGARTGLLDYAATGRFPGAGPRALFAGLVAVLPNVIVTGKPTVFAAEILAGLAVLVFLRARLIARLELGGRRGA
jgi:hypothetical protein